MPYIALIIEDVVINKWEIIEEVVIFGRSKDSDIQIDDQSVSSKHARIIVEEDPYLDDQKHYYLEDLKSTNGTQVNDQTITKQKLNDEDQLKIGFSQFKFVDSKNNHLDETAVILD
ncbi:MAG: FHA domain-containing protein [Kangiellaceae bacterium]